MKEVGANTVSGKLRLDAGAIEELTGLCDKVVKNLDTSINAADALSVVEGFGGFDSSAELQEGYRLKASGGEASIRERLEELKTAVMSVSDAIQSGGDAFSDQDSQVMQQILKIAGEIKS